MQNETNTTIAGLGQFASEKARMASGQHRKFSSGTDRFNRLAVALTGELAVTDTVSVSVSFAALNAAMGASRKVGPEGVASWRTLLHRATSVVELPRYSIDTERGAVILYRD